MYEGIEPGLKGEVITVVTQDMIAKHLPNGVLSTPSLVELIEAAGMKAVQLYLPPAHTTVGFEVNIKHLAPTPLGERVTVRVELIKVDNHKLTFRVEAFDEHRQMGVGTHRRAIIDRSGFGGKGNP